MVVYTARTVLPVATPPIRDGAVAVEGNRITAVDTRGRVLQAAGDQADVRDLGDAVLLPGLVNAHAHVELSWLGQAPLPEGNFVEWVRAVLERRGSERPDTAVPAAEAAIERMVARGTVAVGDVSNGTWVAPILVRSRLQGVVFHEVYGFRSAEAESVLSDAVERLDLIASSTGFERAGERWRLVLTPHAAHTTSPSLLRALAGRSAAAAEPLTIHVAESRDESALLQDGSGAFADLLRERGQWEESWSAPRLSPVEHLDRLGVLSRRTLAVHCVQVTQREHATLQRRGVTVVSCPRSNRRLGVGRSPIPAILSSGIPVALGTDSLASVDDLDLFAEMAALRAEHPKLSPAAVVRMATLNGAHALGLGDRLGSIEPGKQAELIVVPLPSPGDDAAELLCSVPERVFRLEEAPTGGGEPCGS